jgi:hypothetical protein
MGDGPTLVGTPGCTSGQPGGTDVGVGCFAEKVFAATDDSADSREATVFADVGLLYSHQSSKP